MLSLPPFPYLLYFSAKMEVESFYYFCPSWKKRGGGREERRLSQKRSDDSSTTPQPRPLFLRNKSRRSSIFFLGDPVSLKSTKKMHFLLAAPCEKKMSVPPPPPIKVPCTSFSRKVPFFLSGLPQKTLELVLCIQQASFFPFLPLPPL